MGVVYRARHMALNRVFAVKLIRSAGAAGHTFLARFRIEAAALGRLKHPHIVDVTDFGVDVREGGVPYLVMEYLEGETLDARLRRTGPFAIDKVLRILDAIAGAVDFAHAHGVLHRDLKPANIFLATDASEALDVKILDFGLARLLDNDATSQLATSPGRSGWSANGVSASAVMGSGETHEIPLGRETTDLHDQSLDGMQVQRLTEPGSFAGTPLYMAPELLRGQEPSAASDIYALGTLTYEIVVGRPPFRGTVLEVCQSHLNQPPPSPRTLRPSVPPELDAPLLAPLAKDSTQRPRCAADLVAQIRPAFHRSRVREWREREIPRRVRLSLLMTPLLVLIATGLSRMGIIEDLERRSVDARFAIQPRRPIDRRLLLVLLDEPSVRADPRPLVDKADEVGRLLQRVFESGAQAVTIDLLLPEKWSHSQAFSQLILNHPDAMTLAALSSPKGETVGPECISGLTAAALGPDRASALFAFVNLEEDPDGVVRRGQFFFRDRDGRQRDTLAGRAVSTLTGSRLNSRSESFWLDYTLEWEAFPRISWKELPTLLKNEPTIFRGKLVVVGADFLGSGDDSHNLPRGLARSSSLSGPALQAMMINTILEGAPLRQPNSVYLVLGLGALSIPLLVGFLCLTGRVVAFSLLMGMSLGYLLGAFFLMSHGRYLIPLVVPLTMGWIAAAFGLLLRWKLSPFPEAT